MILKYDQGHSKLYKWVKPNEYYHYAKMDIYCIYSVAMLKFLPLWTATLALIITKDMWVKNLTFHGLTMEKGNKLIEVTIFKLLTSLSLGFEPPWQIVLSTFAASCHQHPDKQTNKHPDQELMIIMQTSLFTSAWYNWTLRIKTAVFKKVRYIMSKWY